jgi:CBS domain-containing protein
MARRSVRRPRRSKPRKPKAPVLTVEQKRRRIEQFKKCIRDLEAFDSQKVQKRFGVPEVVALEAAIDKALSSAFGQGTSAYLRYNRAATLDHSPLVIPAFPMDGGRVLRALLATRLGYVRATEVAAAIGQLCAFALGFLGLFSNPVLIFIAIFVYLAASSEAQLVSLRAMSRDVPVSNAMMTEFATLTPDEHIDAAVQTLLRTSQSEFPVVDGNHRLIGLLGRGQIIRALKELGPDAKVGQAMVTEIPTIENRRRLDEAFRLLQEKSAPAVGVVDAAGRLTGLVTSETIGQMLLVKDALPKGGRLGPWSRPAGLESP